MVERSDTMMLTHRDKLRTEMEGVEYCMVIVTVFFKVSSLTDTR